MKCKIRDCRADAIDGYYCEEHSCKECDDGYTDGSAYCERCRCSYKACYRFSSDAKQRCVVHRDIKPLLCVGLKCTKPILDSRQYCEDHACPFYDCKIQKSKWAGACNLHWCIVDDCYRKSMGGVASLCSKHEKARVWENIEYKKGSSNSVFQNSTNNNNSNLQRKKCRSPDCDHELFTIVDHCPIHSCVAPKCINYASSEDGYLCIDHICRMEDCTAQRSLPFLFCEQHATEATHLEEDKSREQPSVQRITPRGVTKVDGKRKFQTEDYDVCRICKCVGIDTEVKDCGHEFHRECIVKWKERSKSCPVCNCNISELTPVVYAAVQ
jgi:hypothetical protein